MIEDPKGKCRCDWVVIRAIVILVCWPLPIATVILVERLKSP
jgi:hypothetical protein